MSFIYKMKKRGICSHLNSLLGLYEEQVLGDKQSIYIDSSESCFFKNLTYFDIFETNNIFINHTKPLQKLIGEKHARSFATRRYSRYISKDKASKAFVLRDNINKRIKATIESLSLPSEFIFLNIRRGDKVMEKPYDWSEKTGRAEARRFEFEDYISQIPKESNVETLFIMTDDYKVIREAEAYISKHKLNYNLITLTLKSQDGHSETLDLRQNVEYSKHFIIKFFTEIEIAKQAAYFIGTKSSNVYRYILNTCTTKTKFISLD